MTVANEAVRVHCSDCEKDSNRTITYNTKETSHIVHVILSLFTGGLWLIIWAICYFSNENFNKRQKQQAIVTLECKHCGEPSCVALN